MALFSPFTVLGVERHSDEKTIRDAYCKLINFYREDTLIQYTNKEIEDMREQITRVSLSFRILIMPQLRRLFVWYDKTKNERNLKLAWDEVERVSKSPNNRLRLGNGAAVGTILNQIDLEEAIREAEVLILNLWKKRTVVFEILILAKLDLQLTENKIDEVHKILKENEQNKPSGLDRSTYERVIDLLKQSTLNMKRFNSTCVPFDGDIQEVTSMITLVNGKLRAIENSLSLFGNIENDLSVRIASINSSIEDFLAIKIVADFQSKLKDKIMIIKTKIEQVKKLPVKKHESNIDANVQLP